ncbi:MAG: DUF4065 domain-containing protein [bacterium]|nr:DUF4065 domain-containing protein [bacterium]
MDTNTLIGPDLVLMLMGAPTKHEQAIHRINGITRLEKLLFLADKEAHVQDNIVDRLSFVAYHYGPYSHAIYKAIELLKEAEFIVEDREIDMASVDDIEEVITGVYEEGSIERRFRLTETGLAVAELLGRKFPEVWQGLTAIKERYADLSLQSLIRYVYTAYPTYAEQSRIRDKVS